MKKAFLPNTLLDTNEEGLALIRRCEAFSPVWYRCPAGLWTIGYGATEGSQVGLNRRAVPGPITVDEAERLLRRSLIQIYEPAVEARVRVPLTSNQFAALVSFVYNVGPRRFGRSTLLRKLNRGDPDGASQEFERWVYAGGQRLRGLEMRREAERRLFEKAAQPSVLSEVDLKKLEPLPPMSVRPTRWLIPNLLPA